MTKTQDLSVWHQTTWNAKTYQQLLQFLRSQADSKYLEFNDKIINDRVRSGLGVRSSLLRPLAKQIAKGDSWGFIRLPHTQADSYEEILMWGMVISFTPMTLKERTTWINKFQTQITNWSHPDCFVHPKLLTPDQLPAYFPQALAKAQSSEVWEARLGLNFLMSYYLQPEYLNQVLTAILANQQPQYYLQMMQAWLLVNAWAKQSSIVKPWLEKHGTQLNSTIVKMWAGKMRDSRLIGLANKNWAKQFKDEHQKN